MIADKATVHIRLDCLQFTRYFVEKRRGQDEKNLKYKAVTKLNKFEIKKLLKKADLEISKILYQMKDFRK